VLEAGVGALARLYEEQVGPELKMNLNRTFLENYSVRSRETAAIDQMQKEVGRGSHRDWNFFGRSSNRRVPRKYETIGPSVPQTGTRFCSRSISRHSVCANAAAPATVRINFPRCQFYFLTRRIVPHARTRFSDTCVLCGAYHCVATLSEIRQRDTPSKHLHGKTVSRGSRNAIAVENGKRRPFCRERVSL